MLVCFTVFRQSRMCNYRKHCKPHENVPKTLQNTINMRVIDNHLRPSKFRGGAWSSLLCGFRTSYHLVWMPATMALSASGK